MPVQTLDLDPSDPDYYQKALETELYNYKLIRKVPTAYQAESWDAYTATANTLLDVYKRQRCMRLLSVVKILFQLNHRRLLKGCIVGYQNVCGLISLFLGARRCV